MGPQKKKNKLLWAAVFVIWALAVGVVVYFSLTRAVSAGAKRLPVYSVEMEEKRAALTFNCAWDETGLDALLAILKEYDARCTFFVVGEFAQRCPDAVRKFITRGTRSATTPWRTRTR